MAGTTYFESPPDFFSLCSALSRGTCSEPCATEVLMRGKPRRPELVRSGIAADLRAFPPWFDARRRRRRPRLTCRRSRKLSHPDVRCASLSARGTRDGRSMEDFLGKPEHPISRFRKIFETAIAPDDSRLRVLWERVDFFGYRLQVAARPSSRRGQQAARVHRANREGKKKGSRAMMRRAKRPSARQSRAPRGSMGRAADGDCFECRVIGTTVCVGAC
jgi:hypothetical protein